VGGDTAALERRIGTKLAARYIGATPKHVIRLVRARVLDGVDVRLPGAGRPTWAITLSSVRRFLAERADKNGLNGPSAAASVDSGGMAGEAGR